MPQGSWDLKGYTHAVERWLNSLNSLPGPTLAKEPFENLMKRTETNGSRGDKIVTWQLVPREKPASRYHLSKS